ncbi:PQQ-binding-like beta-propeller repeat protein [Acidobacteriota bacterium]
MRTKLSKVILTGFVIGFFALSVSAQNWEQWRGTNRDGKVRGFTAPEEWPQELTKKWSSDVGLGDSTPAFVDEKLYVFVSVDNEEMIICLDAASGKVLWKDIYKAQAVTGPASRHPGPRSSPAAGNGKVVTIGVGGVISCLEAETGKLLWRKDPFPKIVPQYFTAMSPLIVDGMAIAHLGGQGNGAVIAYDLTSGDSKWQWSGEAPQYGSPSLLTVAGTKQIATLTEKSLIGLELTSGKMLWQISFVPGQRAYNAATPIIDGDTVFYTGAGRGTFAVKIKKEGDGFKTEEIWSNPDCGVQYNTPVHKDGHLYGLTSRGNFFCINSQNGETAWLDSTPIDRSGFTSLVDVGTVFLALPSGTGLIVIKPSTEKYTELARIKVSESPIYAHPVVVGNRIFIKDANTLTLWTLN